MPIILKGATSGQVTLDTPAIAGTNTITLPASTGTMQLLRLETAQNTTSGTSIDFLNIPSWAKKITVMFNGVSTNRTSNILTQVGSGSVVNTGYVSNAANIPNGSTPVTSSATSGLLLTGANASTVVLSGSVVLTNITGNVWVYTSIFGRSDAAIPIFGGGNSPSLSGTLDRLRITTVNGTDTFDAGTINIMWE